MFQRIHFQSLTKLITLQELKTLGELSHQQLIVFFKHRRPLIFNHAFPI
jgi:hypothetical protein